MDYAERYADSGRFPRAGWYPDADTGIYTVLDGYGGDQRYAGEPPAPAADHRPARPPELNHDPAYPAPAGYLPARPGRLPGGGLAATVAVLVAFATADGSAAANNAKTADTAKSAHTVMTAQTETARAALSGCVSPWAGR